MTITATKSSSTKPSAATAAAAEGGEMARTASTGGASKRRTRATLSRATTRITSMLSYQNVIALASLVLLAIGAVDGLKCHMCGQYNEGVGSITPCLNYSDQYAHLYLKECTKPSEKFCVKYVSELSTVRDCATECVEKEIWETQTYCCNHDGCNGSSALAASTPLILVPVLYSLLKALKPAFGQRH